MATDSAPNPIMFSPLVGCAGDGNRQSGASAAPAARMPIAVRRILYRGVGTGAPGTDFRIASRSGEGVTPSTVERVLRNR